MLDQIRVQAKALQDEKAIQALTQPFADLPLESQRILIRRMGYVTIDRDRLHIDRLKQWITDWKEHHRHPSNFLTPSTLITFLTSYARRMTSHGRP